MSACRKRPKGFSLVELSIVLIIIGIIVSIGVKLLPSLVSTGQMEKDRAILNKVKEAIIGYAAANNRLPCVDGACSAQVGRLPFSDIGLPDGNDAYGRALRYGIYRGNEDPKGLAYAFPTRGAFCIALRQAIVDTNAATSTELNVIGSGTVGTARQNVAFAVIAGGFENLDEEADFDGANAFFDQNNKIDSAADVTLEHPATTRATAPNNQYDDSVMAVSFNELSGAINCGKHIDDIHAEIRLLNDAAYRFNANHSDSEGRCEHTGGGVSPKPGSSQADCDTYNSGGSTNWQYVAGNPSAGYEELDTIIVSGVTDGGHAIQHLVDSGYLAPSHRHDPWDEPAGVRRPYRWAKEDDGWQFFSMGPNGVCGGGDDLTKNSITASIADCN